MKNPNGFGSISNMGGNRRKPFRARVTKGWEYDKETGKRKQIYVTIGYFKTRKEAMMALSQYHMDPYSIDRGTITFAEAYERWSALEYPKMGQSHLYQYKVAYKKAAPIQNMKMKDIRLMHMQAIMDTLKDFSSTTQNRQKMLFRRVFEFCMANDLIDKDYSEYLKTAVAKTDESIHSSYTDHELKLLWKNLNLAVPLQYSAKDIRDINPVDTILMMIYTGVRPSELLKMEIKDIDLEQRYMVGGSKTDSGKNRIIPIHDDIYDLFVKRCSSGNKYLIPYKSDNPPTLQQYRNYMFDPVMKALDLHHLPHDGRHTFATYADRSEVNEVAVARIMGHKLKSITKQVYTHKEIEELVEWCNKITFVEK